MAGELLGSSTSLFSHIFLHLFLLLPCSQLALPHNVHKFLPGFLEGPLPFHLETGYIGVGESEEVQLFYYFVKSERNAEEDPLMLWLTGGPGCSAWSGLVFEVGPIKYNMEHYNRSLPTFVLNPSAWTKVSSIIFVDSPVGTGFSYAKTAAASQTGDFKQVDHLLQFFRKWSIDHPEFSSNPVYVAGDSYSGMIFPVLAQKISNENEVGIKPLINLQGYLLGNPATDPADSRFKIPFAHGMALISDELYQSLERSCEGDYNNINPSNTECKKHLKAYHKLLFQCISDINAEYILEPNCSARISQNITSERRSLNEKPKTIFDPWDTEPMPGCPNNGYFLSAYWANHPDVRLALHIRKGSTINWQRCKLLPYYQHEVHSSFPYHVNLSAKGYRSLIYSGDHDLGVPFLATQAWIRSLNYSIVDDWRPWFVQGFVAGYTKTYSNRMTFATVKGAGHIAPEYKPEQCSAMFKRWINYEPL